MIDKRLLKAALRSRNDYDRDLQVLKEARAIRRDIVWANRDSEQRRIVAEADKLALRIIDEAEAVRATTRKTKQKEKT